MSTLNCPKCRQPMLEVTTDAGVVDRCSGCGGLWFDALEDDDQRPYAASIDIGDPLAGQAQNHNDRIGCPRCANSPLVRMVDAAQPHIWFESCSTCYGRYFDAGEFRDLAEHTLGEWLRRFKVKARPL